MYKIWHKRINYIFKLIKNLCQKLPILKNYLETVSCVSGIKGLMQTLKSF